MHIEEAAKAYLECKQGQLAGHTFEVYSQRLLTFATWCSDHQVQLEDIKSQVLDSFIAHLAETHHSSYHNKPLSTYTLKGYAVVVRAFLRWCMDAEEFEHLVQFRHVRKLHMPKTIRKTIMTFTDEQLSAMFAACEREMNPHLQLRTKTALSILLDTGLRASELCNLTIEHTHLDPGDAYVHVLGKGLKEREVPLGQLSRQMLTEYISTYRADAGPGEPVFGRRYQGDMPLTTSGLASAMSRVCEWAGITGLRDSPHTLRHTYALRFLLEGGSIYTLRLLLGHDRLSTTEIYLRALESRQARKLAVSPLDRLQLAR